MHTVRTQRLLREVCGPDTGSMTSVDRETVMPISLVLGIGVVVLLAGVTVKRRGRWVCVFRHSMCRSWVR